MKLKTVAFIPIAISMIVALAVLFMMYANRLSSILWRICIKKLVQEKLPS
jgi:hypothetical protein